MTRLVVLISGSGSNLQAILDAAKSGVLPAGVVAVVSNRADAFGLTRAESAGIPTEIVPADKFQGRHEYDAVLAETVARYQPDYIILAGWMRILTMQFLGRFPGRVINLHPALPGTFPGIHAIERAYKCWQEGELDKSGVMVHLVPDEGVDVGPVLAKEEVYFKKGESLTDFEARVHEVEHRLLVNAIKQVIRDR
ncbi:MAG: phosphoribosylglycinamide formyltransferase [Anaerolineales bacterium]|nr:phosphoribosylglycinamide formyltransferase [Anaerolineales bacterium]